jgi:serine/threonine protein kinase
MERMESSLAAIVPVLIQNNSSSKTIQIGPITAKIMECVHAVHKCKDIVRDIKTANFMLAPGEGDGMTLEEKLASRIRLLDLAMADQYNNMYLDDEQGGMVGTPLYASLNVHANKKATRRDDLEAVGYVVAELLTQLSSGDPSKQLPWSNGKSDEEIGEIKRAMVSDPNSLFYKQLGDHKTISVFSQYLTTVRGYSFKQEPQYKELTKLLQKLVVQRAKVPSAEKTAAKKSPRRKTPKIATEGGTKHDLSSRSAATQNPTVRSRQNSINVDVDCKKDIVEEMDWEYTNENEVPEEGDKKPKACLDSSRRRDNCVIDECSNRRKKKKARSEVNMWDKSDDDLEDGVATMPTRLQRRGVKVRIVAGPHQGESFVIEDGGMETVVLGSNPTTKMGKVVSLKDKTVAPTHVRLDLSLKKGMKPALTVTNKSKDKKVFVNKDPVNSTKAFIDSTIHIGDTSLMLEAI